MPSEDRSKGHRHLDGGKRSYFHPEKTKHKAHNYNYYAPVFSDGTYLTAWYEVRVDRAWRVAKKHEDQKIQMGKQDCNPPVEGRVGGPSIFPVSLFVRHVGYQDLPIGSICTMVWSPALEIPPDFLVRNRVATMDKLCVVYPGSRRRQCQGALSEWSGAV